MTFLGGTGNLGEILDVSIDNAVSGDNLQYDGTGWVPVSLADYDDIALRVFNLELQQSVLPTNNDLSILSQSLTSRFNMLDTSDTQQDSTIDKLVQGFASLKKTINDLDNLFVAHTGLSGAHDL